MSWLSDMIKGKNMKACSFAITDEDGSNERLFRGFRGDFDNLRKAFPKQRVIILEESLDDCNFEINL